MTGATGWIGRRVCALLGVPVPATHDDLLVGTPDLPGITHLLHLAWVTDHGTFWDDPRNEAWPYASMRLITELHHQGGQRFVFAGTTDRDSRYGRAKLVTSGMLRAYGAAHGISVVTGRIAQPYGPGEKPERLIPTMRRLLEAGEAPTPKNGDAIHDFIHVDDVAAAFVGLLSSDQTGVVDIGTGTYTTVNEMVVRLADEIGCPELVGHLQ